uniref:SMODS and SLOG-associating 2TM effector domain-containing protein n=1 Tax=viral metagenome TaxID=1070528 RepID=A0A6C0JJV7_9ZZZZ
MTKSVSDRDSVSSENKKTRSNADTNVENMVKKVHWSEENEKILVEWCDVAQCYKWLNSRAHAKFAYMHAWFTIPAIVLSTVSGTASFAQTSLPLQYQTYSPMAIGAINIFIGILTTIQQYLKISELNEGHRVSSIAWDKFARNIRIELAKIPDERMDAGPFIKLCRQEFDRLMETSPMIPEKITHEFNTKFKGKDEESIRNFKKLKKPDICDTIVSVSEVRNKWYLQGRDDESESDGDSVILEENLIAKNNLIELQQLAIKEKDEEIKKKHKEDAEKSKKMFDELESLRKQSEVNRMKYEIDLVKIKKYISSFEEMFSRKPLRDEIYDNVKDEVDINSLDDFLEKYMNDDFV